MPTFKVVAPGDLAAPWSRFAVMSRDYALDGVASGDGLLTREELREYIESLGQERIEASAAREPTDVIDMRLDESRRLLRDMDLVNADAVSYLPEALQTLPERLKRRATEMLMMDDEWGLGEIDRGILEAARTRYNEMSGPSLAMISSRNAALADIDEIARALGYD